jgi:hypothetical protein
MLERARKKGILRDETWKKVQEFRKHWNVAVGHEPLKKADAQEALCSARDILSTIPLPAEQERYKV